MSSKGLFMALQSHNNLETYLGKVVRMAVGVREELIFRKEESKNPPATRHTDSSSKTKWVRDERGINFKKRGVKKSFCHTNSSSKIKSSHSLRTAQYQKCHRVFWRIISNRLAPTT